MGLLDAYGSMGKGELSEKIQFPLGAPPVQVRTFEVMQQEVRWSAESGLLRTWKVQPGSVVSEGDVLALVEPRSASLVAPVSGTVVHCLVRNNSKLVEGYVFRL